MTIIPLTLPNNVPLLQKKKNRYTTTIQRTPKTMPPKIPPTTAPKDPTPSNPETTAPPIVASKTDETNEINIQNNVTPKKKTVKKVVKVVVKKLVKRRVPKVGLKKKSEAVENEGILGIGEVGRVENCDGGNGLSENGGKIESSVVNSSFCGGSCDIGEKLGKEDDSGVVESFERDQRIGLVESGGKIESFISNSGFCGGSSNFGGNLENEGNFGGIQDFVNCGSCEVGGNLEKGGSFSKEIRSSGAIHGFGQEEGNKLVDDVAKVGCLASTSVVNVVNLGAMEAGNIGSNPVPAGENRDVGVSLLMDAGSPVEVECFGGVEAMVVGCRGNGENKISDLDVMEVENMGMVETSEIGKDEFMSQNQVDDAKDESLITKAEFAVEKSVENEGSVEGKSEECPNEVEMERGEDEEVTVITGELEATERQKTLKTEIFIGRLDKNATKEDVRKVFEGVGKIIQVRMCINEKTGKNKGYAFVKFASAADAKKALENHSNVEIRGGQCSVAPCEGNGTIFLGNIDKKWKNADVIKLLKDIKIQKIDEVKVINDPNNAELNRGYAFIEFKTNLGAKTAFKKLQHNLPVKFSNLKVAWAKPFSKPDEVVDLQKVKAVYVDYLPPSWDEEKLRNCFKRFGEIENIVHAQNLYSSRRKDFAFVNFVTRDAALACIESFNHGVVDEEGTEVNVKVCLAKTLPKSKTLKMLSASKKKWKAMERTARPVLPRKNKGVTTSHNNKRVAKAESARPFEHGNRRGPANKISSDRAINARISHGDVDARTFHSTDLEQILAERALQKQVHSRLGLTNSIHSPVSSGSKRLLSASAEDFYYPESIRHTRMRVENSFPTGSESMLVDAPYHLVPRVHTHQHAESSFPLVNRSLQADYLYHPDVREHIHVHAGNSFPARSPKIQGDDLSCSDHRVYPRVGSETGADDLYHCDPRGHALVHVEKPFLGRSPNLPADDLLHRVPIQFANVQAENTLASRSLGRSEARPGLGMSFPYSLQSSDFASASDYGGRDYSNSFQREAPIGGSSLPKRWMK